MAQSPPPFNHPYEALCLSEIKWTAVGEIPRTSGLLGGGDGDEDLPRFPPINRPRLNRSAPHRSHFKRPHKSSLYSLFSYLNIRYSPLYNHDKIRYSVNSHWRRNNFIFLCNNFNNCSNYPTDWISDKLCFDSHQGKGFFFSPRYLHQIWGPHSLIINEYRRLLFQRIMGREAEHSSLSNAKLRMSGSIMSHPQIRLWRESDKLTFSTYGVFQGKSAYIVRMFLRLNYIGITKIMYIVLLLQHSGQHRRTFWETQSYFPVLYR
jgi:hypothetical protein